MTTETLPSAEILPFPPPDTWKPGDKITTIQKGTVRKVIAAYPDNELVILKGEKKTIELTFQSIKDEAWKIADVETTPEQALRSNLETLTEPITVHNAPEVLDVFNTLFHQIPLDTQKAAGYTEKEYSEKTLEILGHTAPATQGIPANINTEHTLLAMAYEKKRDEYSAATLGLAADIIPRVRALQQTFTPDTNSKIPPSRQWVKGMSQQASRDFIIEKERIFIQEKPEPERLKYILAAQVLNSLVPRDQLKK